MSAIWDVLIKRYPPAEYALMQEVSNRAGVSRSRSADYMAVSLWPSRGLTITGFEEKASRADWLRELKQPQKQEDFFKHCHNFYLITHDDTLAKLEEIPEPWGWLALKGKRLVTMKEAPRLTPLPVSMDLLCAMLKRACNRDGYVHVSAIQDRINAAREEGERIRDRRAATIQNDFDKQTKRIQEFEEASGIEFGDKLRWNSPSGKELGQIVNFLEKKGIDGFNRDLEKIKHISSELFKFCVEGLCIFEEQKPIEHHEQD